MLGDDEGPDQVGFQHTAQCGQVGVQDRAGRRHPSRVVHERVDAAPLPIDAGHGGLDRVLVADVRDDREYRPGPGQSADLLGEPISVLPPTGQDRRARAFAGQSDGQASADSAARAGDQDDLVRDIDVHASYFLAHMNAPHGT
jgi:hypothetical protein